jgi:hypothetical protein
LRIAKTEFGFIKTIMIIRARGKLPLDRYHVYVFALQQKTAYFKVAIGSRVIQCSFSTEKKKYGQLESKNRASLHRSNNNKERGGNYSQSFAFTSASHWSKRRKTSRRRYLADRCNGVRWLEKAK